MDRVLPSEGRGCWFDPSRAHHTDQAPRCAAWCFFGFWYVLWTDRARWEPACTDELCKPKGVIHHSVHQVSSVTAPRKHEFSCRSWRIPESKEGEERPAREAVLHAIEEAHHDVQGQQQEKIGDESHTKSSFLTTGAQRACMPPDVPHEGQHTLEPSIEMSYPAW